ncbi:hypothetical protein, partial [Achromobacter ruhlandii]|uniref:hypothetical protein n=1 Tax=Achromobacter ruhlandii TaxID=72557 RepID=UPI001B8D5A0C
MRSPTAANNASTCSRCAAPQAWLAYRPVMPSPTLAGVLGMARTIRAWPPSHCDKAVRLTPAAMLTTVVCARRCAWTCPHASRNTCGLVASTHSA